MLAQRRLIAVALISALLGGAIGVLVTARYARIAVAERETRIAERTEAGAVYTPVTVQALPGWSEDSVSQALPALQAACRQLKGLAPEAIIGIGPIARPAAAWHSACDQLQETSDSDADLRMTLDRAFVPYRVTAATGRGQETDQGLFTGYYEAELNGSLVQTGTYRFPIYGLPRSLVMARLKDFLPKPGPPLPGNIPDVLIGRLDGGSNGPRQLRPYYTREQIDDGGAIAGDADVLLWADDPVAVHILHVQGSGRVNLPDGQVIRLAVAGNNGHAFRGIAGILVEAGQLQQGAASMIAVRDWLHDHPDQARDFMNRNARYIFFRRTDNAATEGPIGGLGVPLTAGRSLAVDQRFIPLAAPIWLDTADPDGVRLQRLMVAEDVGGAITGPVRGDFFWGHGEDAFQKAGRMRSSGRYFVFVPRVTSDH